VFEWATRDQRAKRLDGINLIAQTGTVEDLAECYALHESLGLPYAKKSWRILGEMWRALLSKGAMQLCVVANRARLVSARIVSFSAIVFVTDEFCSEARSKLPPYLGVELTQRYLSGQMPVLNRKQVAHANAGDGLNVMVCFEGWTQDALSSQQLFAVRAKQSEALHLALSGYRVNEFLANPIGPNASQWMLDAGARLRRDYTNYFRKNHLSKPESSRRPCLMGLSKEEALAHPGSNLAGVFVYAAPRFHFNRSQRVLLRHALMGQTCEELATSLSLSPWTVKKRWHAIYRRVADVDTALLPPPIAYGVNVSSRGPERRRRLLSYLRQHLEELRPFAPPPRRRGLGLTLESNIKIFVAGITFFGTESLACFCECLSQKL
jgi:DNA-binding CsgD family transcriptional regulator